MCTKYIKRFIFNKIKEKKFDFWGTIFYASLLILAVWLILKSIGITQTPFWLEYGVPFGTFTIGFLAFYQKLLDKVNLIAVGLASLTIKVEHIDKDIEILKKDMVIVKDDITILKKIR